MKKVLLTFYGLVDELRIGELTQEEFEDCKELGCPVRCSEKQRLISPVELLI